MCCVPHYPSFYARKNELLNYVEGDRCGLAVQTRIRVNGETRIKNFIRDEYGRQRSNESTSSASLKTRKARTGGRWWLGPAYAYCKPTKAVVAGVRLHVRRAGGSCSRNDRDDGPLREPP